MKRNKYENDRRKFLEFMPMLLVIIMFLLAFIYIPLWLLGGDREIFASFLYQEITVAFVPVFSMIYIFLKKYNEGVIEKWLLATGYGIIFEMAFYYPRIYGYDQLSFSFANVFYILLIACLANVVYLTYDRSRVVREKYQVEQQNLRSEMALLKNQINPHFLFNTLNNIDSLIKTNQDKASESLIELADMMRYMLYETNANRVPLEKELTYIENFLKLQSMHHANPHLVQYQIKGSTDSIGVAPMLFIPFIENAFKHCTNKDEQHAISFSFEIEAGTIKFMASNLFDRTKKISKDKSNGVGLEIVRRRLELAYPKRHQLQIEERDGSYIVNLAINEYTKDHNNR